MRYIKGLHGVRALSILLVILTHMDLLARIPNNSYVVNHVWPLFSGETGVMIFFVLSGFLITSILLFEKEQTGEINIKHFFIRRFLRLLPPLVLFYGAIILIAVTGWIPIPTESILYAVFYCYNFVPNQFYVYELGHIWSLSVEEQFYLTWPFVVSILARFQSYFIVIGSILILSIIALYIFPSSELLANYKSFRFFIPAVMPIMIGCFGAIVLTKLDGMDFLLSKKSSLIFILGFSLFCIPLILPEILLPIAQFFQSFGVLLLIIWISVRQDSKLVQLLEFRPLKYIGLISYGLYVYQGLFLRTGGGGEHWIHQIPWNVSLSFIAAILSYELIEKRVLKWKKKFSF